MITTNPQDGLKWIDFPREFLFRTGPEYRVGDAPASVRLQQSPNGQTWELVKNSGKLVVGALGRDEAIDLAVVLEQLLAFRGEPKLEF